jgi:hypothetical protein
MRRLALCTVLASLALAAVPAVAAGPVATLTVNPNKAGKGSVATLDVNPPRPAKNPRFIVLRVVRGVKFDGRARAARCSMPQANSDTCPPGSRIGGGVTDVTVTSNTGAFAPQHIKIDVNLYLMNPLQSGDRAGVVAEFKVRATGQKGRAFGRVTKIAQGPYGLQTRFGKLDTALSPPAGTKAHVDHMHLTFGAHRTVTKNGTPVRYDLITNPKTCDGTWEYQVVIGYPTGSPVVHNGSGPCRT